MEQPNIMEGRQYPGQYVIGFHWALMCWESSFDLGLSLWECWKGPSSSPYALRHSPWSSQYIRHFSALCWRNTHHSSNGSFLLCIKWASPLMVSESVLFFGKEATAVLSHLEKMTHILLFRHKPTVSLPLWKSGLQLTQLLSQIGKQNLSSTFT